MRVGKRQITLCTCLALVTAPSIGQDTKKPAKKAGPKVVLMLPLGATLGTTTKFTIRGQNLEQAQAVKLSDGTVKILSKSKSAPPDKLPPEKYGDSQIDVEVKLAAKLPNERVLFTVVTPDGETAPHEILVDAQVPIIKEKEPNDGFRQAQPIQLPCVIEGSVDRQRDVDVYRIAGKAGQKVVAEVLASRHGSALDALLTLYTSAGNQLASSSDGPVKLDARLTATLPSDGVYYLALIDAHDSGGALHVYRLVLK